MKLRRKDMKKIQARNSCLLLLTAIVWGMAFVAQSAGMEHVGPFTFNSVRNIIGGLVLIPVILVIRKINGEQRPFVTKIELIGGICCGIALFAASSFQQQGILYTTVGKAGFITALYVVIVPILGLFFKKRMPLLTWGCVALAVVGLYLLCMTGDSLVLNHGDLMVLICAVIFAGHILIIDYQYYNIFEGNHTVALKKFSTQCLQHLNILYWD
jgi:drug/metabolite transporter (DMT)-like permease